MKLRNRLEDQYCKRIALVVNIPVSAQPQRTRRTSTNLGTRPASNRKLSVPTLLYSPVPKLGKLGDPPTPTDGESGGGNVRQRRFSNVGDAVSRKLSTTMGWRAVVSVQEVVSQAKSLASQFIRARLKRSGAIAARHGTNR